MAHRSWLEGLLTALAAVTVVALLHRSGAWPAVANVVDALLQAGRAADLRWLWLAWLLALVALARHGAAR